MTKYSVSIYRCNPCLGFGFWIGFKTSTQYKVLTIYLPFIVLAINFKKTIFNEYYGKK